MTKVLVLVWLAAITAANVIAAHVGPQATIYTAFGLIGLTLVVRDRLHDEWRTGRVWKMALLIAAGSALAWIVSPDAGKIGLASGLAFLCSETADATVYAAVHRWPWMERSNTSNLVGAAVDSLVFPTVAFGGLLWSVTVGQFTAKVAGALLFTLLLEKSRQRRLTPETA